MMKKILMSVYAACAALVIIGSLLWFVFTLHSDSVARKAEALNHFKIFAQHTGEILSESAQENDPTRVQSRLEQLCRNYSKYTQAVLIRDTAGIIFMWPNNSDIFSYNEQYVVEVKNLPLFFTAAQTHIPIKETGNTVTVHAAFQTLPIEIIFNRGQIVFFLLLLIVLMTVMVLIFSYINPKYAGKKTTFKNTVSFSKTTIPDSGIEYSEEYSTESNTTEAVEYDTETDSEAEEDAAPQEEHLADYDRFSNRHKEPAAKEIKTEPSDTPKSPLPLNAQLESLNRLHIYDDDPSRHIQTESTASIHTMPFGSDLKTLKSNVDAQQPVPQEPDKPEHAATPEKQHLDAENYGSFENHTQTLKAVPETQEPEKPVATAPTFENTPLSDTEHTDSHSLEQATLIEELTAAITETAVAEEDLTLLLIHATDIPHNQQIIHLLRATLDRIHKIFIFNKDTLGLIIFYAPLDQAMQIASTIYDEIHGLLDPSVKRSLGIGLTTRAGRLIPAPRMIEEAAAAIDKATEEGSDPIVAFRVNPDKYRRCLARLN